MGFEWAYRNGEPPWDIGRPQPVLVRLAEQGLISGSVIDVGCGTGENVLHLAALGLDVTGIDLAPTAVARARAKAASRGLKATFEIVDALELGALHRTFDAAVDFGLFHVFSDAERAVYERSLHGALRPGARYFFLCFSDEETGGMGPRRVSQTEIRATFTTGWRIDSIVAERFATRDASGFPEPPRAWLASLTRLPGGRDEADRRRDGLPR
jgi:SAM-dependent methyltransferase